MNQAIPRLLIQIENGDYDFARISAFPNHLTVDLYRRHWLSGQLHPASTEVLKFTEHPELVDIYRLSAWSAIGLAALVDIFATDDEEDQTGIPEIQTGTPIH